MSQNDSPSGHMKAAIIAGIFAVIAACVSGGFLLANTLLEKRVPIVSHPPTPTLAETVVASTPTDTPIPPTNTPAPSTDTPTLQSPISTPDTLVPITFMTKPGEDLQGIVDAHQPVIVEWWWGVCRPESLQDNLDALTCEVTVDGRIVATGSMAEYRSEAQNGDREGRFHGWVVYYSYPMGAFESGSIHRFKRKCRFSQVVTDGCDSDGDGRLDMFGPGYQQIFTATLEITVR